MEVIIPLHTRDVVNSSSRKRPYLFSQPNIVAYAKACKGIVDAIKTEQPDVYFCPLRGSYPVTRVVLPHVVQDVCSVAYVTTSGFLLNRRDIIRSALETIIQRLSDNGNIAIVDTAITGSSIRDFRRIIKEDLSLLMAKKGIQRLNIEVMKLWKNRKFPNNYGGESKSLNNGAEIIFHDYNFGVPDLFCEDDPDLLGIDYLDHTTGGKKHSTLHQIDSRRGIVVKSRSGDCEYAGKSDSQLFVDIASKELELLLTQ